MSQKLFFFDLDRTLLKVNISFAFGKYLYAKGEFPFAKMLYCTFLYGQHKFLNLTLYELQKKIFESYFCGQLVKKIECYSESFIGKNFSSLIYTPAFLALQAAKKAGDHVMILSSSPNFLVAPIAKSFGVEWNATNYLADSNGRFAALENVLDGNAKAQIVKKMAKSKQIEQSNIFVYSDSYLDLPFLETAGNPIAVNPDKILLKISLHNKWKII